MIKALKRLHADSDSFREREGQSDRERKKEENHVCSTKPVVSKGSIEAWSKRLLTCQPSRTTSLSLCLSLCVYRPNLAHKNSQMHTKADDHFSFN